MNLVVLIVGILEEQVLEVIGAIPVMVVMAEVVAAAAAVAAEEEISSPTCHILSGTFIPSNPMAEEITLAVISEIFNLNCFFSSDSAFITECSV